MMSDFIITEYDIKEAKRYYEQDRIKDILLEGLFRGMLYCFLSIGQLYKTQMMIYRDLINNNMDKLDFICGNIPLLKTILLKARFPNSMLKYIFEFKNKWNNIHRHYFNFIIWDIKENDKKFSYEIRDTLVKNIKGVGYKVASLFLDICGYNNISVIDIWSLRFLKEKGYIEKIYYGKKSGESRGISKNKYIEYENYMKIEADKYGYSVGFFQLLVWVKLSSWNKRYDKNQLLLNFDEDKK